MHDLRVNVAIQQRCIDSAPFVDGNQLSPSRMLLSLPNIHLWGKSLPSTHLSRETYLMLNHEGRTTPIHIYDRVFPKAQFLKGGHLRYTFMKGRTSPIHNYEQRTSLRHSYEGKTSLIYIYEGKASPIHSYAQRTSLRHIYEVKTSQIFNI